MKEKAAKGTLSVEKAKVNGATVTKADKTVLDQLLEKIDLDRAADEASFKIIDVELSREIVGTMRGHFAKNLIYNIPRKTAKGRKSLRECDLMTGGCPYKDQFPHIHILGVGIQGALTAMRSYGRISATIPDMPEVVEQADRLYWAAYAVAIDGHTGNEYGRWYFEPLMRKAGNRNIENEFGASICESKALRNVILGVIPSRLMESWLEDYRDGKQAFNVKTAKQMGYGPEPGTRRPPQKPKLKPKANKAKANTPGKRDLDAVIGKLAGEMAVDSAELSSWSNEHFGTTGKAMLQLNRALDDNEAKASVLVEFNEWKSKQTEGTETQEGKEESTEKPEGEQPENGMDFDALIAKVAPLLDTTAKRLGEYTAGIGKTRAQITLLLASIMKKDPPDPIVLGDLQKKFAAWQAKNGGEKQQEIDM